ncbi:MAG: hypothetical protein U0871_14100 [Gemmataceae bacterium]
MSITFGCKCGQTLQVEDEHAGMQVQCPTCNAIVAAPAAGPTLARRATRPAAAPAEDRPSRRPIDEDDRPSRRRPVDEDEDDRPSRRRRRDEDDEDEGDRPRRRKRRKQSAGGWHGARIGTLVGGVLGLLFFGALAFFILTGNNDRRFGKGIGCAVAAVASVVPIGRSLFGMVSDDEGD